MVFWIRYTAAMFFLVLAIAAFREAALAHSIPLHIMAAVFGFIAAVALPEA